MNTNKKFGLIFLVLVILPIMVFIFKDSFISLGSQKNNQLNNVLLSIAVIGCGVIFYKNKKSENAKKIWYVIPVIIIVFMVLVLYIGNSISHFGF